MSEKELLFELAERSMKNGDMFMGELLIARLSALSNSFTKLEEDRFDHLLWDRDMYPPVYDEDSKWT